MYPDRVILCAADRVDLSTVERVILSVAERVILSVADRVILSAADRVILSAAKDLYRKCNKNVMHRYYVYMMGSPNGRALYVGMTNDLLRRVREHKSGVADGFTKRYRCVALLYYEAFSDVRDAIAREKQIKGWLREKKERLIGSTNPGRVDLADEI